MHIQNWEVPAKPFLAFAYRQGHAERTLNHTGHVSMEAARRAADKLMRAIQAGEQVNPGGQVLMAWGYQKIEDHDRRLGIVV